MLNTEEALIACLPPVSYDPFGAHVRLEMRTIAAPLDDTIDSAGTVLAEHQPDLSEQALGDWERNHSLPDDVSGSAGVASLAVRRANLLARINQIGNLSRQHMVDLAEVVGFPDAVVLEHVAMTCSDPCDTSVMDDGWIGAWRLVVPAGYTGSAEQLRRLMQRRKPAHTIVFVELEGA